MFTKLIKSLGLSFDKQHPFDPSQFEDPIARQTEWIPLKGGGTNFRTHKMVQNGMGRFEFRASLEARLFYLVFVLIGIGVAIAWPASQFLTGTFTFDPDVIFPLLFGLVFAAAGGIMFYFGTIPIVFDKQRGFYWKGRKAPYEMYHRAALKHYARLEDIHALQLISEYCHSNKSSYYSYELNLVLKNGQRLNVIDHGNLQKLREDAAALSRFLGKPVWDALEING